MRRTVAILALVAMVFLFSAPELRGAGGLVSPPKTVGPAVSFSMVTVIADTDTMTNTKGLTALRVQKSGTFDGALFFSSYVAGFVSGCIIPGFTLQTSTEIRFKGYMDAWVPFNVRSQLFQNLGAPGNAAITNITDIACSIVDGVTSLSFTGTIQFATTPP